MAATTKSAILPNAVRVSPTIRVGRWSLLVLGIMYGANRRSRLIKKENARRAQEEAERPAKEAAIKAEKDRKNAEELAYLSSLGVDMGGGGGGSRGGSSSGGGGSSGGAGGKYQSECGCSY